MYMNKEVKRGYNSYLEMGLNDGNTGMDVGLLVLEPGDEYSFEEAEKEIAAARVRLSEACCSSSDCCDDCDCANGECKDSDKCDKDCDCKEDPCCKDKDCCKDCDCADKKSANGKCGDDCKDCDC